MRRSRSTAGLILIAIAAAAWLSNCAADVHPTETELAATATNANGNASASASGGGGGPSTSTSTTTTTAASGSGGSAPSTCSDGVQNGGESDIDCGGPCPQGSCALGKRCDKKTDCVVGECVPGIGNGAAKVCTPPIDAIWTLRDSGMNAGMGTPTGRYYSRFAYDNLDHVSLLFGGSPHPENVTEVNTDALWTWDGVKWSELDPPSTAGLIRYAEVFVYDTARDRTTLFGGANASGTQSDTWEFDGQKWLPQSIAMPPPAETNMASAYDADRAKTVMATLDGQTWLYDGASSTWTEWFPDGGATPDGRQLAGMAFDAEHHVTVLFGGTTAASVAETWTWDGNAWTELIPDQAPPARFGLGMAYDSARRRTVIFGGTTNGNDTLGDTWEWDGVTWTQTSSSGPIARANLALTYDGDRGRIVMFGGGDQLNEGYADTWEYYVRGNPCSSNTECDTGHCVDGLCCEQAACGSCEACNLPTDPVAMTVLGQCAPVKGAKDPDSCAKSCDATGACK